MCFKNQYFVMIRAKIQQKSCNTDTHGVDMSPIRLMAASLLLQLLKKYIVSNLNLVFIVVTYDLQRVHLLLCLPCSQKQAGRGHW